MKKTLACVSAAALACICLPIIAMGGKTVNRDIRKTGLPRSDAQKLDVSISFSGEEGQTVTDSRGTTYHFWGMSCWERKVYPVEYRGVFPLYFFDSVVGVTIRIVNRDQRNGSSLKLVKECSVLQTDGNNGAQLLAPVETAIQLAPGETKTVDGSFLAGYVPGADSGLDRYVLKIVKPGKPTSSTTGPHDITGDVNINPNNSADNEFVLLLPGGSAITRDDLHEGYAGYDGPATMAHLKPKGNGNQNSLIVDGQPYLLANANTYDIDCEGMIVHLFNDRVDAQGKAMGHWWISFGSAAAASLTVSVDNDELLMSKEAVFCPPEVEQKAAAVMGEFLGE